MFRRGGAAPGPGPRWIPAAESPFGCDVLDCRPWIAGRAAAPDTAAAARFAALRGADGTAHRGRAPEPPATLECRLEWAWTAPATDGALFLAAVPEHKWDVFLWDRDLYLARSWSGALEYRAAATLGPGRLRVSAVTARREVAEADPAFALATVDFVVRAHLLGEEAPHPLPAGVAGSPEELAALSFNLFGSAARWAAAAEDVLALRGPARRG
jgi:hypothetical protein